MNITNEQKQVMLSGILGDGYLKKEGGMTFSCSHKEYMEFKKELLGNLCISEVKENMNNGYKKAPIYSISCKTSDYGKLLLKYNYKDITKELNSLGVAMWLFDDGAIHQKHYFFNISTHAIDLNVQKEILIPLPPIKEQQRIVAQIEKLFEQLR